MTGKSAQRRAAATRAAAKIQRPTKSEEKTFTVKTVEVSPDSDDTDSKHQLGLRELEDRVCDVRESCWSNESLFEDIIEGIEEAKLNAAGQPPMPTNPPAHLAHHS